MTDIRIIRATWEDQRAAIKQVRQRVFIEEQGVTAADEWDDQDDCSHHVLALTANRDVVATGRLQRDAKITRMAVLSGWRGQRVGAAILTALLDIAAEQGMEGLWLHAQQSAIGFYQRYGFVNEGEPFDEAGIAHVTMRRHNI
ncbi:MAG: GNAT family N-acetyltransferase [Pseudomonadota bacterium]